MALAAMNFGNSHPVGAFRGCLPGGFIGRGMAPQAPRKSQV